ncbi:OLC1v1030212C1 [Oldenlandia corymbosa var. corymbosa]|uniref:OLC1v1030212C1 n=1 Tax=Oldenlandia corymbosa var. corymbosa TaxID=529605 RepID=A0AAV1CFD6_OLDCO|nr:OLC1v1030212C1 [Oldenlandia corymbosa var. corymbosa]
MSSPAASFICSFSAPIFAPRTYLTSPCTQLKTNRCGGRRVLLFRVKCRPEQSTSEILKDSESEITESTSADDTRRWYGVLGGLGFLETSYLTFLKLTQSEAFCPVNGGSCGSILNSDYSLVFGVPLPLIGMLSYGTVATLGLYLSGKRLPFEIDETNARSILLVTTTSMAVASSYFLYILSTQFSGESCLYCLASAALSLSLFFITIKDFGSKQLVLQLCVAIFVVTALSTSYNMSQPISTSLAEVELPYVKPEVTTKSSPWAVSLAKHLRSIGAKVFGAFWCSHCLEQKEMFGREAAEILDYVECFPDGYRKGTKIAKACADAKIEGFPTWVINGEVLSGELDLSELAKASGFELEELNQAN